MYHKKPQRRIGKRRVKGPKGMTVNTVEMATSRSGSLSRAQTETPSRTPTPTEISHDLGLRELEERAKDVRESCWTHDSLFEDAVDGIPSDTKFAADDPDACSPAEAYHLRQLLRTIGPREFCLRTVDSGRYTAKRLLTAFNIRAPAFLDGAPEEAYTSMLTLAFSRELAKRAKLPSHNSLDDAVALLTRSRNIMVITGAGISTSLGIPDFRSKKTGLYAQLEHMGLAVHDPQEVFDINVFRDDPTIFYTVAKDIIVNTDRYSPTHAFIAMLDRMGKLLTNYTQNIDNLCISLDPINHINFDIDLLGHCDVVVAELCRRAGWDLRHDMVPRGQAVDVHTEPGFEHRHRFTQVYPAAKRSESPVDLKRSS
ncbi:Serine/threonine-protein kinase KSP1 [Verticillium dahliae VDG1]|nr:Serine/threonine-protein kinase KSP1 [Verticillium dahliae VDG1]